MGRKTKDRHIHQYERRSDGLWYCFDPFCYHFIPSNVINGHIGRASLCWGCSDKITLDSSNSILDRPLCFECIASGAIVDSPISKAIDPNLMITNDDDLMEFIRLQEEKSNKNKE
jgi:hypothetical protein